MKAPCDPIEESGLYRFSKVGEHRFIRFRDDKDQFLDRYEYTLKGKTLRLLQDGSTEWHTFRLSSGGSLQSGPSSFIDSADGLECEMPSIHCVTTDHSACPQLSPLPPSFCAEGEIRRGEVSFIDSADGLECAMPSVHCLTRDHSACPQLSPLPPTWCSDGERVSGPSTFITSADGMECAMPSVHCVTLDNSACPQLSPLSPEFCAP